MSDELTVHLDPDRLGVALLRVGDETIGEVERGDAGEWTIAFHAGAVGKRLNVGHLEAATLEARAMILGRPEG